ncbi:GNAT family N-acetyltransferase [Kineococcus indalonis]|uniref:GNAT family N-acetyltransferase n=1 Tax=Kineococcus indalonis TaxID=2696566 RepID=UPI00141321D9|nr:GNAT family N-acetyltransferase [Kineococcus indalonis]NAZ87122.1 GNAT family N-acetyltransferase [Kineococcus indalonis]
MTERAPLSFREAGPADVPAVVELVESAYRGEASRAGWTTEADLLGGQRTDAAGVGAVVEDPEAVLLLAERGPGAQLVACCELRRAGDDAYFGTFAVRPHLQGAGIGRRVLERADAEAVRRWGAAALEMTVIAQRTDLIAWYERRGFTPTGERRPFPHGDERFGVPRRDDLEFAVLRRATGSPSGSAAS